MRFLPLAGALLLFGIAIVWRAWLQHRRHGTWGIALFRSRRRGQDLRDAMLVVFYVIFLGQAAVAASQPDWLSGRQLVDDAALAALPSAGAVLMFAGLGGMVLSQLDLGASWRVGIDESTTPGLVTGGAYRFCRNPIFLALLVMIVGYALLLPTRLSVVLLAGAFTGIHLQVRAEEAYLLATYAQSYREYARRVGRFLPGLGRLR